MMTFVANEDKKIAALNELFNIGDSVVISKFFKMNKNFCLLIMIVLCISSLACKKAGDEVKIKIEGFQLFDAQGNLMAKVGAPDNDWQFINWSSLSLFEQSLLNSADDVDTNNTSVATVAFYPYPNPVQFVSTLSVQATDSVKFKLIAVDEKGTVLKQLAHKLKGSTSFQLDISDSNLFPSKKSLRYYYSFSAANNLHFKVGYGDIKVCDYTPGQNPVEDCFK